LLTKEPIIPDRIRRMDGGFGWIPYKFIKDGHIRMCNKDMLLVYFFLNIVGDRLGLSFYGDKTICKLLGISEEILKSARQSLQDRGFIVYKRPLYQVLPLPQVN